MIVPLAVSSRYVSGEQPLPHRVADTSVRELSRTEGTGAVARGGKAWCNNLERYADYASRLVYRIFKGEMPFWNFRTAFRHVPKSVQACAEKRSGVS